MRFRPEQHVRRQHDFRDAREKGRRLECGGFTIWCYKRPEPVSGSGVKLPRVGVIASTAAVGMAVYRNRAKRRLRELFRKHQGLVPSDYDLLLVARHATIRQPFEALEAKFLDACRKAFPTR